MQLRQFEYVDAVLRHGSIRAASRHLLISEPAISVQLRALERELKVTLFVRQGRGLELTPEGTVLAPLIQHIVSSAQAVSTTATELRQPGGALRVGVVPTYAFTFVRELMRLCAEDYPALSLEVSEGGSLTLEQEVSADHLDLALVTRAAGLSMRDTRLAVLSVCPGRFVAVVSEVHALAAQKRVTVENLRTESLVLFRQGYITREIVLHLLGRDAPLHTLYTSDNSETARQLVRRGLGVSFAIDLGIAGFDASSEPKLVLLPVPAAPATELCCVYAKNRYLPGLVAEAVVKQLRALIGNHYR